MQCKFIRKILLSSPTSPAVQDAILHLWLDEVRRSNGIFDKSRSVINVDANRMEWRQVHIVLAQQIHSAQEGNQQIVIDIERNIKALGVTCKDRNGNRIVWNYRLTSIHVAICGAVGNFAVALGRMDRLLVCGRRRVHNQNFILDYFVMDSVQLRCRVASWWRWRS